MRVQDALALCPLPRREASLLLAHALGKDDAWLLAHPEEEAPADALGRFEIYAQRRITGEPVAYILGEREFYGRPFLVDPRVLIPRPSTEGLIEAALRFLREPPGGTTEIDEGIVAWARVLRPPLPGTIVDVGTGCGCVALTLAAERPDMEILATDVSAPALDVARQNARRLLLEDRVRFLEGDLLAPVAGLERPFLLVSNPPYVPTTYPLEGDTLAEPISALTAGPDGADVLRRLVAQARSHPACIGWVIECRADQVED